MNLLGDDEGSGFNINEDFAKKYEEKKRREELSKLQDKYGPDYALEDEEGSDESTDYSSEDSDAEFVTPEVDAAILKIIGKIRQGGSELYSGNKDFFQEEEERLARIAAKTSKKDKKASKKEKPVHLKDFQRKALMATAGEGFDDEDAKAIPTPAQEAEALRQETKAAFLNAVNGKSSDASEADEDEDDLLVRRDAQEVEDDDDQYRRFLLENVGQEELDRALAIQRQNEKERKMDAEGGEKAADDDFLKNYILNRGWLDKKSKSIPSYKEIVKEKPEASTSKLTSYTASGANAVNLLEEDSEEEFERAEDFETKYNFRAGGEIQTHARDLTTSIRRTDDSRKREREARAARKAEEKQQKMEELKRLKNLKKQEILDKIEKIKEIAGEVEGFDYSALDLEGDYDPEKHNALMSKAFNAAYYDAVDDNVKPEWEDDIDISDIVPADKHDEAYAPGGEAYDPTETAPSGKKSRAERKKDKKKKKGKGRAEDDANGMDGINDAAGDSLGQEVQLDNQEMDAIADPEKRKRKIEAYMDELYKLDYEDMIGDLPTRFHYTTSAFNTRGTSNDPYTLTPAEILMATDAELNAFESLKKLAPFRQDDSDRANKKRKKLKELRKVLAARRWGEDLPEEGDEFVSYGLKYAKGPSKQDEVHPTAKAKRKAENGEAEGQSKKKRVGAKERKKLKAKAEAEGAAKHASETA